MSRSRGKEKPKTGKEQIGTEGAESSNINKGFLSLILQASASLSVPLPHAVHITAFCHRSHVAPAASAGHFALLHSS